MKAAVRLGALVAVAAVAFGQAPKGNPTNTKSTRQPAATRIGDHWLGETFFEWLAIEKIDLDAACDSGARVKDSDANTWRNMSNADRLTAQDDKGLCDALSPSRYVGDGNFRYQRASRSASAGILWSFFNRKLVGEEDVSSADNATHELSFLREAYGPPVQTTKIPPQNAYGARWDDIHVTWHLPDGATLSMRVFGGPNDGFKTTFRSKDYPDTPTSKGPNPYLPTAH